VSPFLSAPFNHSRFNKLTPQPANPTKFFFENSISTTKTQRAQRFGTHQCRNGRSGLGFCPTNLSEPWCSSYLCGSTLKITKRTHLARAPHQKMRNRFLPNEPKRQIGALFSAPLRLCGMHPFHRKQIGIRVTHPSSVIRKLRNEAISRGVKWLNRYMSELGQEPERATDCAEAENYQTNPTVRDHKFQHFRSQIVRKGQSQTVSRVFTKRTHRSARSSKFQVQEFKVSEITKRSQPSGSGQKETGHDGTQSQL
jgi:hypothetical protein